MGNTSQADDFTTKLRRYKQLIDADIESYATHIEKTTMEQYGERASIALEAYLQILRRGGKRIRGALVLAGYDMAGGTDENVAVQAARAIEMFHAYLLVIDDIQDRSPLRRGGPTAHKHLESHHILNKFLGDPAHFGRSVGINGALIGLHAAEAMVGEIPVVPERRLRAIDIINKALLVTIHGQTHDITNESLADVGVDDIERVMEWKTAAYTILNPLQVGIVLAGASDDDLQVIVPYAIHAGKAFQITDDIIGTFGEEQVTHKDPMDDIREGKQTLLTAHALRHAKPAEQTFLRHCLGNAKLTKLQFKQCRAILESSGALAAAREAASEHITQAHRALGQASGRWRPEGVVFLGQLAEFLSHRVN